MILKAVYPYEGPFNGTLKFKENDLFLHIRDENDYWYLVCREDGTVGCVPRNYVDNFRGNDEIIAHRFASRTINSLRRGDVKLKDQVAILGILQQFVNESKVLKEIDGPIGTSSPKIMKNGILGRTISKTQQKIPEYSGNQPQQDDDIKSKLPYQIVDILRLGTNASYADCRWTLLGILTHLSNEVPSFKSDADRLCDKLACQNGGSSHIEHLTYYQSSDWFKLKKLFGVIEARQKNGQECNWQLHQNQSELSSCLDKLLDLVAKADSGLVLHYLDSTGYHPLSCLIQLYQREHRPGIRHRLLLITGVCCCLGQTCLSVAIQSVLPSELIRELTMCGDSADILHISECMRMLTILLAWNTELPVSLKAQLDGKFGLLLLQFVGHFSDDKTRASPETRQSQAGNLIDLCSEPEALAVSSSVQCSARPRPTTSGQLAFAGRLSEAATLLLLAVNWHFCSLSTIRLAVVGEKNAGGPRECTPVVRAVAGQANSPSTRRFIRLLLELFNRDVDPIFLVDYRCQTSATGSVSLLKRWVEVLSQSPGDSSVLAACFRSPSLDDGLGDTLDDCEEEGSGDPVVLATTGTGGSEANAGQYAQHFWSENLASRLAERERQPAGLTPRLPAGVTPMTPVNSVTKMVCDLLASPKSARLVYGGDLEVIIDVISRQLGNLSPELPAIADYLVLFGLLLTNTDYLSHGRGAYKIHEILGSIRTLLDMAAGLPRSVNVTRSVDYATGILTRIRCSTSD